MRVHNVETSEDPLVEEVRNLFMEYQRELGIDLCFQGFDDELQTLPGKYGPPSGALVLLERDGEIGGCGALYDMGDATCELKRVYVRPAWRGLGLGKKLTQLLLDRARELGYVRARLDTLARLATAVAMYRGFGFYEIEPYNFNPEADIVYMELEL
jgi:putative acetyltransferase